MATPTWKEIRDAAEEAGLDARSWERGMHDRILNGVLNRTKSIEQYHYDAEFHARMETMLSYILGVIFEHSPLSEGMRHRAEALTRVFLDEIGEARERG